ncbi:hypothetical protein [Acidisoma cladoniae]|jgi:toxin ParE1/3/4|uniref:hypothetical protein n=1 Tax=Acidisoma cladoniae TaxID=3040935 RepID=UPI00254F6023|nr:hypothetical protein [Acidisoma sp. PAMC 29798]
MIDLLDRGAQLFGEAARDRYATLILQAMQDVADDPRTPGARPERGIDPAVLFYHLRHSRNRVEDTSRRVHSPRHILVYEPAADGSVNILGLIPDMIPPAVAVPRFIEGGEAEADP